MIVLKNEKTKNRQLSVASIVGITLFGVVILMFVGYQIYMFAQGNELKTEVAFADSSARQLAVDMFVVRDEKIITEKGSNVVSAVKDGTRVSVNDTVAYSFSNSDSAGKIIRMGEIRELLDYYGSLLNASSSIVGDTAVYDEKIIDNLYSFSAMISSGDFSGLEENQKDMRDAITSKQTATGVQLDLSQTINQLNAEYAALSSEAANYKEIKSGGTGYYISGSDGYENTLSYSDVAEWTIADVNAAIASDPQPISPNAAGRLVHGYYWYLACVVNTSDINSLHEGSRYTITFPDSSVDDIKAQVYIISSDREMGKSLVVFKCNMMNEELATLRCESAVINVEEYEGYRVDNRAIRVNEDNEKGVYIVSGGYMYFRKIKIIFSTDDYSIVADPYKDSEIVKDGQTSKYLHLYDEYIIEGRDLSHGRLLKN